MFSSKFVIVHFTWFINMNKCIFVVFRLSVCVYFLSVNSKRNLASETVFFTDWVLFWKRAQLNTHSQLFMLFYGMQYALKLWNFEVKFYVLFLCEMDFYQSIRCSTKTSESILSQNEDKDKQTAFESLTSTYGMKYWHKD